jgi:hypothetical protein
MAYKSSISRPHMIQFVPKLFNIDFQKQVINKQNPAHAMVHLKNFGSLEHYTTILDECITQNIKISVDGINSKYTYGFVNKTECENLIDNKYNIHKINVYKVYSIGYDNDLNPAYKLSYDIKRLKTKGGIHIRMDSKNNDNKVSPFFEQCCSISLSNCYDAHKDLEILIEVDTYDQLKSIAEPLNFYGHDMYFKIKFVNNSEYGGIDEKDTMGLPIYDIQRVYPESKISEFFSTWKISLNGKK